MQKYFVTNSRSYACTNSLQKQGSHALRWLDKILVDDLPKLEATIRSSIDLLNKGNQRCKPLEVDFSVPNQHGVGHCGIRDQYMFYIYAVAKDYTEETFNFQKIREKGVING